MIKRYFLLFIVALPILLIAQSPEKLIDKGEYDQAIEECVKRISNGRGNKADHYASLKTAYETSNKQDMDTIILLKSTGNPGIWYDVFTTYYGMQKRYKLISAIKGQLRDDQVNIMLADYSEDMEAARNNAIAYLYAHSVSLLRSEEKNDAWQAYLELLKITKLVKGYLDVETLMRQALGAGAGMALLEVKNSSDVSLSPDFLAEMENIALTYKEKQFLDYVVKTEHGEKYPIILKINIKTLKVTPGTVSEKEYTSSHKNPQSLETAYKDDTKKEEDKNHADYNKCKIKEIYQHKTALMTGTLSYIDGYTGTVLYIVPVTARSVFENKTATASGDMFACPPEIYDILENPKKKFPDSADMIYDVGKEFKLLVKGIVWNDAFIK